MRLYAILLWCLYPLAPAKRIYELTRRTLQITLEKLSDQRWIDWLCQNPDHPHAFACFERIIDTLNDSIDLIVYLKARELLGLPNHDWTTPREAPLRPRRSRSFADLWRQLELCVLRFGDVDRLAAKRAIKLQRLYEAAPRTAEDIATAAWRTAATTIVQQQSNPDCQAASAPAQTTTLAATPTRAGLRVRAPPWRLIANPESKRPRLAALQRGRGRLFNRSGA